jgi:K+-transporting ATPase A subunit
VRNFCENITIAAVSILTPVSIVISIVVMPQLTVSTNAQQVTFKTPEELIQKIYQVHQPWINKRINLV